MICKISNANSYCIGSLFGLVWSYSRWLSGDLFGIHTIHCLDHCSTVKHLKIRNLQTAILLLSHQPLFTFFRQAFKVRGLSYNHNPVGPDFFGLRKNTIAKMIQDLPNVDKCMQYIWQTFEPARFNKPGRNRRRLDTMVSGSILGGVNYGLTSGRLNTAASHQQQIQQRRLPSTAGVTGTIDANYSSADESSRPESSYASSPPQSSKPLQLYHHYTNLSNHSPRSSSPSYSHTYHSTSPSSAPIKTV